jgi:hypothetical protein
VNTDGTVNCAGSENMSIRDIVGYVDNTIQPLATGVAWLSGLVDVHGWYGRLVLMPERSALLDPYCYGCPNWFSVFSASLSRYTKTL